MGLLRNMLHGLAFTFLLILPFTEPSWNPRGWDIILGAVIPALVPMTFVIIMLDTLMCKVYQTDAQDLQKKQRYGLIVKTNLLIGFILLLTWLAALNDALF